MHRPLRLALFIALAAACDARNLTNDAATDVSVVSDARDVAVEASALVHRRCANNGDCGVGNRCDLAYPGGLCTRSCDSDAQCGERSFCAGGQCRPSCALGADSCATYGGACFYLSAERQDDHVCYPSCYTTPVAEVPACVASTSCDPYRSECVPSVSSSGAINGAACTRNEDCRSGRCHAESEAAGHLGGACYSVGRIPPMSEYVGGAAMPRSNCPEGNVVIPYQDDVAGEPRECSPECRAESDCRPGFTCNRITSLGTAMPVYATGGCVPIDCLREGASCPAGARCDRRAFPGGAFGVCVRDGDAGAADASTTDATVADVAAD